MRRNCGLIFVGTILLLYASPSVAVLRLDDGGIHNIDYALDVDVWVDYESFGLQTTVNILDGASLPDLGGFGDSIINVYGGYVNLILTFGNTQVNFSGGSAKWIVAAEGQVTFSGGSANEVMTYSEYASITVSGGSISRLHAFEGGRITLTGGSIIDTDEYDSLLIATLSGVMTIRGSNFAVDGTPVGNIGLFSLPGGSSTEPYRRLTGTLLNGDPLDTDFHIAYRGMIVLVPEPGTSLIFALGGLTLLRKLKHA